MTKDISIVVPVYNEEKSIRPFLSALEKTFLNEKISYEVIFCLDPSVDNTEEEILRESANNKNIKLLLLSRRFGQPAATIAGIANSSGRFCAVIDVDLQDPPELILPMYRKIIEGYEVVYAKRKSRKGETFLKKRISEFGYWLINKLSDVRIPRDAGDFRIMSRKVVDEVLKCSEANGFLRGLVAYVGFKQTFIEYDRNERFTGSGKYNRFIGSLRIGLNGLIGFSSKPLFLMSITGFILSFFGFTIGVLYALGRIFDIGIIPGLPTTVLFITFFSGIQLMALGLLGEYVGRIYEEVKRRPMYIINKKINFDSD